MRNRRGKITHRNGQFWFPFHDIISVIPPSKFFIKSNYRSDWIYCKWAWNNVISDIHKKIILFSNFGYIILFDIDRRSYPVLKCTYWTMNFNKIQNSCINIQNITKTLNFYVTRQSCKKHFISFIQHFISRFVNLVTTFKKRLQNLKVTIPFRKWRLE